MQGIRLTHQGVVAERDVGKDSFMGVIIDVGEVVSQSEDGRCGRGCGGFE